MNSNLFFEIREYFPKSPGFFPVTSVIRMSALVKKKMVSAWSGSVVYIQPQCWCTITYGAKFGHFHCIGAKKKDKSEKVKYVPG